MNQKIIGTYYDNKTNSYGLITDNKKSKPIIIRENNNSFIHILDLEKNKNVAYLSIKNDDEIYEIDKDKRDILNFIYFNLCL